MIVTRKVVKLFFPLRGPLQLERFRQEAGEPAGGAAAGEAEGEEEAGTGDVDMS